MGGNLQNKTKIKWRENSNSLFNVFSFNVLYPRNRYLNFRAKISNFESAFVYKKGASFGKSQLLKGSTLANQNKMLRMIKS